MAAIGQGRGAGTAVGIVSTNFTVNGDFTATITGDFSGFAPACNLCGNQEAGVFQANFNAGGVANLFGVSDENFAVGLGDNMDDNPAQIERGFFHSGGDFVNSFQIRRIGGVVTIGVGIGGGNSFDVRQTSSAANLQGPVALEFYFENGNNNGAAGSTSWSNFTITGDSFDGLQAVGGAAPEPAAWALMIAGFGLAGAALRSRRRKAPA
ncbi:PEPxxWA-CTERM sorting domain-containing protein [Phenylobacterium sp.]|uniref:PEPxxWA-CTERM sorting domain-containing protein n=1 Tax=Phenylobacterium sp. TaxID=1871053 RepID=UPI002BB837DE|nr:PEPxxWA-CTERM sorting domain-containing protein [Phenylobacterium sp.]HLZ76930.1 PEPxxWA-CTERM sorting domain-containing protein [Phenylobacterium sp.]